jgi:hypothetical protein
MIEVQPILRIPARKGDAARGLVARRSSTWLSVQFAEEENPWDNAYKLLAPGRSFAAGQPIEAVEPDHVQDWLYKEPVGDRDTMAAAGDKKELCTFDEQDGKGGKAKGSGIAWNFGDDFSELATARARVGSKLENIVIAHLDTGYDPKHVTLPAKLRKDLQRNFVKDGGPPNDATDRTPPGMQLVRNRGHGSATLGLLAGNKLDGTSPGWSNFRDYVGGAPLAQVIPLRVANWVVRFTTGTLVEGFNYARVHGAHVLSMSMGGLASEALVDAVNLAYDDGVVLVTAAGNNIAGIPSPKSIVFPARLRRVLAACGVMADGSAYANLAFGTMQGNFGPASKMDTALGAYTPNVPWVQIDCEKVVDMDGAGTSSATPQIAAAAALWLAEHWPTVSAYSEPWMRVETVRHALFTAAAKRTAKMNEAETFEKIGQGVLRADAALRVRPLAEDQLRRRRLPPAEASWSWLNLILGGGVSLAAVRPSPRQAMLMLELTQMAQRVPEVAAAIADPDKPADEIPAVARRSYLEAALDHGNPSKPLRAWLERTLAREPVMVAAPAPATKVAVTKRKQAKLPPPARRLRVYALDPSISTSLASQAVNETTLTVPWDDNLKPGPVGEYLEVVDVDPASNKIYEPVDLNDKTLLAQDGWPPSEGNPQFHQQMVYAVAMTTIRHFEQALGRKALWAPRFDEIGRGTEDRRRKAYEVPRLRLYPHALRTDNAYYSPEKKALLFGYFLAEYSNGASTAPGSMVFTCLSHDIIAHEMSHALLDGLHRRFQEASNLDVPAFHEAFADIVALFQHFTVKELVRFEISRARGDLSGAELLGGLAKQFGEGSSRGGPLRNYLDKRMQTLKYADTVEPHDRGSLLVFAVYEAFRNIVARRTEDLFRLATGGSGVLPAGAIHPDLVNRLTQETCVAAGHVLRICIRALDYCPAVDITFGEYLRALITADLDLVPDDQHGYRVAFLEAFRNRGILPRDVRTFSVEALAWKTLDDPRPPWLAEILDEVDLSWDQDLNRSEIFALNERNRWKLWGNLKKVFAEDPEVLAQFGLLPDLPRYDQHGKLLKQPARGETTFDVFSVRPVRRVAPDGSFRIEMIAVIHQRRPVAFEGEDIENGWFWFRGGATLIVDPHKDHQQIRYIIVKNAGSQSRLERQREVAAANFLSPLQGLYFGEVEDEPFAMMHSSYRGLHNG